MGKWNEMQHNEWRFRPWCCTARLYWANEMKFSMNHVPGTGLITLPPPTHVRKWMRLKFRCKNQNKGDLSVDLLTWPTVLELHSWENHEYMYYFGFGNLYSCLSYSLKKVRKLSGIQAIMTADWSFPPHTHSHIYHLCTWQKKLQYTADFYYALGQQKVSLYLEIKSIVFWVTILHYKATLGWGQSWLMTWILVLIKPKA